MCFYLHHSLRRDILFLSCPSFTKVCMLGGKSLKLGLFFYYHMENHISVWHIDWTIFVGVVALLTEYFNKMGGGEGKHIFFWSKSTFNYFLFLYSLELKGKLKKRSDEKYFLSTFHQICHVTCSESQSLVVISRS